ncbi:MAG TPA: redoxin domain-containing protein, partial [Rhizobiales bacterium]|nr:redoxin domain-containing protein [Hyphomicrobiales bacterium]
MAHDIIREGVAAPGFEFESASGEIICLGDLKGKPVVVYFYPKDDTSGCTRQAIEFTELIDGFSSLG